MANRSVGNVLIVDSGMGNAPLLGVGSSLTNLSISAIGFYGINTTASLVFTGVNTTNQICRFNFFNHGVGTASSVIILQSQYISFTPPLKLDDIKCITVTACTGWIYLA